MGREEERPSWGDINFVDHSSNRDNLEWVEKLGHQRPVSCQDIARCFTPKGISNAVLFDSPLGCPGFGSHWLITEINEDAEIIELQECRPSGYRSKEAKLIKIRPDRLTFTGLTTFIYELPDGSQVDLQTAMELLINNDPDNRPKLVQETTYFSDEKGEFKVSFDRVSPRT